jgi:uncharacterized membrane protein YgcG
LTLARFRLLLRLLLATPPLRLPLAPSSSSARGRLAELLLHVGASMCMSTKLSSSSRVSARPPRAARGWAEDEGAAVEEEKAAAAGGGGPGGVSGGAGGGGAGGGGAGGGGAGGGSSSSVSDDRSPSKREVTSAIPIAAAGPTPIA